VKPGCASCSSSILSTDILRSETTSEESDSAGGWIGVVSAFPACSAEPSDDGVDSVLGEVDPVGVASMSIAPAAWMPPAVMMTACIKVVRVMYDERIKTELIEDKPKSSVYVSLSWVV
jgi:hypothetical protein